MTDGSQLIRIQREEGEHGEACLDTSGDVVNWKGDGTSSRKMIEVLTLVEQV